MWFDPLLHFRAHAKAVGARGKPTVALLERVSGKVMGIAPGLAVKAVLLPTLLYATEAWHGRRGECYVNDKLDVVVNDGLRAALPTWSTTRVPALYLESGIPAAVYLVEDRKNAFARRLVSARLAVPRGP